MADHPESNPRAEMGPALRIFLLGGFALRTGGHAVQPDWRLRTAANLVKLLALAPNKSLHRDQLIELLWPGTTPSPSLNTFYQTLHVARRTLENASAPSQMISFNRQIVSLAPPGGLWVDVAAFEQAASHALESRDKVDYYAAIDLYRGDLLPENRYEDWTEPRRQQLADSYLNLLLELATIHVTHGERQLAIELYRRVIEREPALEHAHAALMRLYAEAGRIRQALRQYRRLQDILDAESATVPSAATIALYEEIERQTRQRPATADGPELRFPADLPAPSQVPFVGREDELSDLHEIFERAMGGTLQIALVHGEAGIGKTRLAGAFIERLSGREVHIRRSSCRSEHVEASLAPLIEIIEGDEEELPNRDLRQLQDRSLREVDPAASHHLNQTAPDLLPGTIAERVLRLSRSGPLLIFLDDLHRASSVLLLTLEQLAGALAACPVMVLVTVIPSEEEELRVFNEFLARLQRRHAVEMVAVEGLSEASTGQLIAAITNRPSPADLTTAIWQETQGNPLFISEVVRLLWSEHGDPDQAPAQAWRLAVPGQTADAIRLCLDRLSGRALTLVQLAAAGTRRTNRVILERASDLSAADFSTAIDEAVGTGLFREVHDGDERLEFTHRLVEETIYHDMSRDRRQDIHRRLASAIEECYAPDLSPHFPAIARHLELAGEDLDRAVAYMQQAGEQAAGEYRWTEAVSCFQQALDMLSRSQQNSPDVECHLLIALGDTQTRAGVSRGGEFGAGHVPVARRSYRRAAELALALAHPEYLARASLGFSGYSPDITQGDLNGIKWLDRARNLFDGQDHPLHARVLARLASYHRTLSSGEGRPQPGGTEADTERLCDEALAMARRLDDPMARGYALVHRNLSLVGPDCLQERLSDSAEIIQIAHQQADYELLSWGLHQQYEYTMAMGHVTISRSILGQLDWIAEYLRMPYFQWFAAVENAGIALGTGDYDRAERYIEQAEATWPRTGTGGWMLIALRREQGRLEEAAARLDVNWERLITSPLQLAYQLMFLVETGRHDEARLRLMLQPVQPILDAPRRCDWLRTVTLLADVAIALDDGAMMQAIYDRLLPYSELDTVTPNTRYPSGAIAGYLGRLASHLDCAAEAIAHLERAASLDERRGFVPSQLRHLLALAEHLAFRANPSYRTRARSIINEVTECAESSKLKHLYEQATHLMSGL